MIRVVTVIEEKPNDEGQTVMSINTNVITKDNFTNNELVHAGRIMGVLKKTNDDFQLEFEMTQIVLEDVAARRAFEEAENNKKSVKKTDGEDDK